VASKRRIKKVVTSDPILVETDVDVSYVTCDNLRDKSPEKYEAIVEHLIAGQPQNKIAANFKVSSVIVRAVARTEEKVITALKKEIRGELILSSLDGIKSYGDALRNGEIKLENIPLHVCMMMDKALLLEGSATSIIETRSSDNSIEGFLNQWQETGVIETKTKAIKTVTEQSDSA